MTVHAIDGFLARFGWPANKGTHQFCIGHRGASGHRTENTLPAFELAAQLGAEMWELDTQLTRDGVVVVCHDDHLLRIFGVDRRISDLTATELAELAPDVPTFAQVAELGQQTNTGLYIELKAPGTGIRCWQYLLVRGQQFAGFGSFDVAQVRELRDAGCTYPLSVLVRIGDDPHAQGDLASADILHLCWERAGERPQDLVTPELLQRAFAQQREIVLWHEERPEILQDLMAFPVLAICTDLPELMRPDAAPEAAG